MAIPLKEKIADDLKNALKSSYLLKRDTLRLLFSAVKNTEIEKKKKKEGLNDQEVLEVIRKAIRQRKDSIEQYKMGGRSDLADKEEREMEILSAYLPAQLSEEKIREEIRKVISEAKGGSLGDFGKIMGIVMKRLQGQAEGSLVKKIVEEELGS
jgi:uncharacterized protein YqeY